MVTKRLAVGVALGVLSAVPTGAEEMVFPADAFFHNNPNASVIDVTQPPYNADPMGQRDSTAAINQALDDYDTPDGETARVGGVIVYLPNGTYRVSDTLLFTDTQKIKKGSRELENKTATSGLSLWGQSRDGVVINLEPQQGDKSFDDPEKPKPVIATSVPGRFNFDSFATSVANLTVDVGGHAGAVGIAFAGNNQAFLQDCRIVARGGGGHAGVSMDMIPGAGPDLHRRIDIEGFRFGYEVDHPGYHHTLEHIALQGQREAGVRAHHKHLTIRDLQSNSRVPAIVATNPNSTITIVDSRLTGGSADQPAIVNSGFLFARNITTEGYGVPILENGKPVRVDLETGEYITDGKPGTQDIFALGNTSANKSLNLPAEEAPDVPWDPMDQWVNVQDFGAIPGDGEKHEEAIQAAIDSMNDPTHANFGKTTLYFPHPPKHPNEASYVLDDTIHLRGNVRRVHGMKSRFFLSPGLRKSGKPLFRIEQSNHPAVVLEHFVTNWDRNDTTNPGIEVVGDADVIARHITVWTGIAMRATGKGRLFIEDFHAISNPGAQAPIFDLQNQRVWARNINPERNAAHGKSLAAIGVNGGTFWALGYKTESAAPIISVTDGGKAEVLGGMLWSHDEEKVPVFHVDHAWLTVTPYAERQSPKNQNKVFDIVAEADFDGKVSRLLTTEIPQNEPTPGDQASGFRLPMLLCYPPAK